MPRIKIWGFCISLFLSLLGLLPLAVTQATKEISSTSSPAAVEDASSASLGQDAASLTNPSSVNDSAPRSKKAAKNIDYRGWFVHFGIAWTVVLGIIALGIFLSEAHKLNEQWTEKANLALKGAGGLVIIVLTYWIGMISENRASEEKAAKDRIETMAQKEATRKVDAERIAEAERKGAEAQQNNASRKADETRRKAERAEFVVKNLGESNETVRLSAIAIAGGSLQEDSLYSLTMLQVLFTIARSDRSQDKALRDSARDFLPPLKDSSLVNHRDAVSAILDSYRNLNDQPFRKKLQDGGSPAVDRAILALSAIGRDATVLKVRDEANRLTENLSPIALAIAKAPGASSETIEQLAPSLLLAARSADTAISEEKRDEAQKLLSKLPQEVVESAVQRLPQTLNSNPSSFLVYVHIAHEGQRRLGTHFQEELQKKGFVVPGIQNVGGKASVPEDNEVRRFLDEDSDTVGASARVLEILRPLDNDKSRAYYVRPTSDKERKKGRLEVWFSGQYRGPAWPGYSGWIVIGHFSEERWKRAFLDFPPTETPDSLAAKSNTLDGFLSTTTGTHFLYLGSMSDAKKIGGLAVGQRVRLREIRQPSGTDTVYARVEVESRPNETP